MQGEQAPKAVENGTAGTHGHTPIDLQRLRLIDAEAEALGVAELQRRLWDAAVEIEVYRNATLGVPPDMARNAIKAWTRDPIGWGMGTHQIEQLRAAIGEQS